MALYLTQRIVGVNPKCQNYLHFFKWQNMYLYSKMLSRINFKLILLKRVEIGEISIALYIL